jgi:hypothetical protein
MTGTRQASDKPNNHRHWLSLRREPRRRSFRVIVSSVAFVWLVASSGSAAGATTVKSSTFGTLRLPFGPSSTWKVTQGYNAGDHGDGTGTTVPGTSYALDVARSSGATAGQSVFSPASGTIDTAAAIYRCSSADGQLLGGWGFTLHLSDPAPGMHLYLQLCHLAVKPAVGAIAKGQLLGTVKQDTTPSNSHIHVALFKSTAPAGAARTAVPFDAEYALGGYAFPATQKLNAYSCGGSYHPACALTLAGPDAWPTALLGSNRSNGASPALASTGGNSAVVAYEDPATFDTRTVVVTRQTSDGGAHWTSPARVAGTNSEPALATGSQGAYLATTNLALNRILLRTSSNGGSTWGPATVLSAANGRIVEGASIAASGTDVAVCWIDETASQDLVRISHDGGITFGAAHAFHAQFVDTRQCSVAVGSGVVYVLYWATQTTLKVAASTDAGVTWPRVTTIGLNQNPTASIAAEGSTAIVAYGDTGFLFVRSTRNGGLTWAGSISVGEPTYSQRVPRITRGAGVWRLTYFKCVNRCAKIQLLYRASSNGVNWSDASHVAGPSVHGFEPVAVAAVGGRTLIEYDDSTNTTNRVAVARLP